MPGHATPTDPHARDIVVESPDGHRATLLVRLPPAPRASLLWLPALGVAARHYLPLADALAGRGIAVFLHEWRGHGSSNVRAGRHHDWGYRELLRDIDASTAAVAAASPGLPRRVGGHSLGGQLAGLHLAMHPDVATSLWLVASGSPYFRAFPRPQRWGLPLAYRFLPWLARFNGRLPGRLIRFAGNEARGVVADWARTALGGRYAAAGVDLDLESAMARFTGEARAVVMAGDWLAPPSSVAFLLAKFRPSRREVVVLDAAALGTRADHFAWMKRPDAVAAFLAG